MAQIVQTPVSGGWACSTHRPAWPVSVTHKRMETLLLYTVPDVTPPLRAAFGIAAGKMCREHHCLLLGSIHLRTQHALAGYSESKAASRL